MKKQTRETRKQSICEGSHPSRDTTKKQIKRKNKQAVHKGKSDSNPGVIRCGRAGNSEAPTAYESTVRK
jgi:hypothetical protein